MTREDVLREFGSAWRTSATDAMADEIVRLREREQKAREASASGRIWSLVRKTLARANIATATATSYEHASAQLDKMARQCEADVLAALGGDA